MFNFGAQGINVKSLGPFVRKPINADLGMKFINQSSCFSYSKEF